MRRKSTTVKAGGAKCVKSVGTLKTWNEYMLGAEYRSLESSRRVSLTWPIYVVDQHAEPSKAIAIAETDVQEPAILVGDATTAQ